MKKIAARNNPKLANKIIIATSSVNSNHSQEIFQHHIATASDIDKIRWNKLYGDILRDILSGESLWRR